MAKSTRSKVKRSFRSKKRETGVYAATEAARLNRLNAKLISVASKDKDGDALIEDAEDISPETMASLTDSQSVEDARKTRAEALTEPYPGTRTMKEKCFDPVPDILMWMDEDDNVVGSKTSQADAMDLDQAAADKSQRVSTHGPRGSRREEWRVANGMSARPNPSGMNRQGGVAARRKAGRSKRRR